VLVSVLYVTGKLRRRDITLLVHQNGASRQVCEYRNMIWRYNTKICNMFLFKRVCICIEMC